MPVYTTASTLRMQAILSKFAPGDHHNYQALEHNLFYIVLSLFCLFLCIQLYYILFVQGRLRAHAIEHLHPETVYPPLSVIICARNEEENLKMYLAEVLEQD